MNMDNRRLTEIQQLKIGYQSLQDKAMTLSEIFEYDKKIQELEQEEKEILARCDVII